MNTNREIQTIFLNLLKQRIPCHISIVHEISELLGISYDSAYRRMRGDKNLSIEELKILSQKYRISLDSLFGPTNADILFHPFVLKGPDGFKDWLQLRIKEAQKINESRDKTLIMVARDLPIYYFFNIPEFNTPLIFKQQFSPIPAVL